MKYKYIIDEIPEKLTCCICGKKIEGEGNNPFPVKQEGRCCDKCNLEKVIPARIEKIKAGDSKPVKDNLDEYLQKLRARLEAIKEVELETQQEINKISKKIDLEKIEEAEPTDEEYAEIEKEAEEELKNYKPGKEKEFDKELAKGIDEEEAKEVYEEDDENENWSDWYKNHYDEDDDFLEDSKRNKK